MRKSKELSSIRCFLKQKVEEGELESGFMQDVERSMIELEQAMRDGDRELMLVAINDIARKFLR